MTDIATLGTLLRLARDTVTNPREGAATVLSFAPAREALWLMFALVVVASLIMGEIMSLMMGMPTEGPLTGPMQQSPLMLGLIQGGLLFVSIHAIHRIGRFFGGTGSLEEAALLIIWLQFILLCVQVVQLAAIVILPPVAGLITILAIALFFWLLTNFIAVLHGFQSLGMVFVTTLFAAFGLLVLLSLVLSMLGLAMPTG
jgi:hypothetical protein